MLRLRLSRGADVFIGDNIKVIVLNIDKNNNQVELGFQAPREIKILRGYLYRTHGNEHKSTPQKDITTPPQDTN